jgi:hypothetical protein
MPINRAPYDLLIDDSGNNADGTPWNKQQIKDVILDPVDAAILPTWGVWTPGDQSGAGLVFSTAKGRYCKTDKRVYVWGHVTYPATANGAGAMINGLPFNNTGDMYVGFYVSYGIAANLHLAISNDWFYVLAPGGGPMPNSTLSGLQLIFQGEYYTD